MSSHPHPFDNYDAANNLAYADAAAQYQHLASQYNDFPHQQQQSLQSTSNSPLHSNVAHSTGSNMGVTAPGSVATGPPPPSQQQHHEMNSAAQASLSMGNTAGFSTTANLMNNMNPPRTNSTNSNNTLIAPRGSQQTLSNNNNNPTRNIGLSAARQSALQVISPVTNHISHNTNSSGMSNIPGSTTNPGIFSTNGIPHNLPNGGVVGATGSRNLLHGMMTHSNAPIPSINPTSATAAFFSGAGGASGTTAGSASGGPLGNYLPYSNPHHGQPSTIPPPHHPHHAAATAAHNLPPHHQDPFQHSLANAHVAAHLSQHPQLAPLSPRLPPPHHHHLSQHHLPQHMNTHPYSTPHHLSISQAQAAQGYPSLLSASAAVTETPANTTINPSHHTLPHSMQPPSTHPPIIPNDHDVLSGRGVNIAHHLGNERFRSLITTYQDQNYCTSYSATEKRAVALEIINHIKELEPPGRFLKRHGRGQVVRGLQGPWEELSERESIKKTCQALRDCNRTDRTGYAIGVCAPGDVQDAARQANETGMSTKERARKAAKKITTGGSGNGSSSTTGAGGDGGSGVGALKMESHLDKARILSPGSSLDMSSTTYSSSKRRREDIEELSPVPTDSTNALGTSPAVNNGAVVTAPGAIPGPAVGIDTDGAIPIGNTPPIDARYLSSTSNTPSSLSQQARVPTAAAAAQYPAPSSSTMPMIPTRNSLSYLQQPQPSHSALAHHAGLSSHLQPSYLGMHPSAIGGVGGAGGGPGNILPPPGGAGNVHIQPRPSFNPTAGLSAYDAAMAIEPTGALAAATHPYSSILNNSFPKSREIFSEVLGGVGEGKAQMMNEGALTMKPETPVAGRSTYDLGKGEERRTTMNGGEVDSSSIVGPNAGAEGQERHDQTPTPPPPHAQEIQPWPQAKKQRSDEPSLAGTSVDESSTTSPTSHYNGVGRGGLGIVSSPGDCGAVGSEGVTDSVLGSISSPNRDNNSASINLPDEGDDDDRAQTNLPIMNSMDDTTEPADSALFRIEEEDNETPPIPGSRNLVKTDDKDIQSSESTITTSNNSPSANGGDVLAPPEEIPEDDHRGVDSSKNEIKLHDSSENFDDELDFENDE